ncbi:VOC family protein [Staphylococcus haemolyticus]|nr:VOC family protein [Staphylococcus haemolyticus]MDT0723729.1 VOC family protein [Staphylococcus haemolyticus]MDU0422448.1 VOC family protein [Staphylococcus haemolyticus]MDU0441981.1 VOC family protein [Staphylococcus haemolyticus]MDU0444036.1 VOC family protein [Staphylococcus haemolyticus]MDU0473973.1 VOC family protein [Staphylococcus haemolyticus]
MIQSMWFNLHVEDLERSEQFYRDLGFEINKNPDMLDKMVGIKIGQTIVILIENNHFEKVTHESVSKQPNEVIISLGVKTNDEVDELMRKVESSGGKVIDEPGTYQG